MGGLLEEFQVTEERNPMPVSHCIEIRAINWFCQVNIQKHDDFVMYLTTYS